MRVLKLKPQEDKRRRLGLGEGDFVHTLGPRKRLGVVFEDFGENHRFVEENPRITIILIIRVSSFSFLMFYPKFMMYQTSSMF